MKRLRLFIADDHGIILDGLRLLLNEQDDMEVVGEAKNGHDAYRGACALQPDVLITDICMPQLDGAQLTRRLQQSSPGIKIVVLSAHEESRYIRQMLTLGAAGYVLKRSMADELLRAIRSVAAGGVYIDPLVAGKIAHSYAGRGGGSEGDKLSEREAEVLKLIAHGYSNKELAEQLCLSIKTVETYKNRLCEKLQLNSRVDIVRYAISQGWLQD